MNILIIEDHPLMVESYEQILVSTFKGQITVRAETSFFKAREILIGGYFDIVILDWLTDREFTNGGEILLLLAKQNNPNCKVLVITSVVDAITLYEISRTFRAEAVLVKSDITNYEITEAIKSVLNNNSYFSPTVLSGVKKISNEKFYIDNYNRNILILLSKGIKSKNLINFIPLSMSAIDKRKAAMKDIFSLKKKANDEDLISEARKRQII